jgi:hypothetical protein
MVCDNVCTETERLVGLAYEEGFFLKGRGVLNRRVADFYVPHKFCVNLLFSYSYSALFRLFRTSLMQPRIPANAASEEMFSLRPSSVDSLS